MEILLMLFSFGFMWGWLSLLQQEEKRFTFLKTALLQGLLVVLSTEILSYFHQIHLKAILLLWLLNTLLQVVIFFKLLRFKKKSFLTFFQEFLSSLPAKSTSRLFFLKSVLLLILGFSLMTALLAPPNNPDAMAYHLPRVMHWAQNQSVEHYPTADLRQISFSPGVGYFLLHVYLLTDSDRFLNGVQWFSFLGTLIGLSLLTKFLGKTEAEWFTLLLGATVPMAILQSMTTQTDLTVAFWLITATCFLFQTQNYSWQALSWFGLSISFGILSKPTAILFGASLGVVLWGRAFQQKKTFGDWLRKGFFVGILAFCLSIPHYLRNQETFGNFLGIDTGTRNTSLDPRGTLSNLLRNVALNVPLMMLWEPLQACCNFLLSDPSLRQAVTFENGSLHEELRWATIVPHEDFVGAPFHFLLIVFGLLGWFKKRLHSSSGTLDAFFIAIILGFLLFCFLLKWQEWGNRLLLPCFMMSLPFAGIWLSQIQRDYLRFFWIFLLGVTGIFYSLTPIQHPLVALPPKWTTSAQSPSILFLPREAIYLSGNRNLEPTFLPFIQYVTQENCRHFGIQMSFGEWEYALWGILRTQGFWPFRLQHIGVENVSQKHPKEFSEQEICAILKIIPHRLK